ncbi:hypothetical protein FQY83_11060 [Luteimonas marina]|uniref:Uncharacterized protein n=1 Tax=Luteimonas marina TaxID=488485 RepID=A0A5C5U2U6_9GAMM|nr:hypothetical protein [Luteimonas marina]TWT20267.1 hypothetical protein FQY83_11060 [Luteimonas marina]
MSESNPASTHVEGEGLRLDVDFSAPSGDTVQVRYRLRNDGAAPLAVFDRGNRHAVLTKRQAPGAIGVPTFEETGGGDVVLRHVAPPQADAPTGPTLPPTPLALKLEPGASIEGEFGFSIPASAPPRRVRWCLGVAAFDDVDFFSPEATDAGEVWQAGAGAIARQRVLCTPWFGMAAGRFGRD